MGGNETGALRGKQQKVKCPKATGSSGHEREGPGPNSGVYGATGQEGTTKSEMLPTQHGASA